MVIIRPIVCVGVACVIVAGCAGERSPGDTVRAYHAALANKRCAQAEALLTAQSAAITKVVIGNSFEAFCENPWTGPYTGHTVQRVEIQDEFEHKPSGMWTLTALLVFDDQRVKKETVRLIREAGEWKIMFE